MNLTKLQNSFRTLTTWYSTHARNDDHTPLLVSGSDIHGKGVICTVPVRAGDSIYVLEGTETSFISSSTNEAQSIPMWYGLGNGRWLDPGEHIGRYINHSCSPTAAIVGTRTIVARRDLLVGEEVTIDYSMTDEDPLWVMPCRCGDKNCRQEIRAIQFISEETFLNHYPLIPIYFQKIYKQAHPNLATLQVCEEYADKRYL